MDSVNITLAIPKELQEKMKRYEEIRWSSVIRHVIEHKIQDLEVLDKLTAKSELTGADAIEIGRMIKRSAAKRLVLHDAHNRR